jgi:hypothetical protein
MFKKRRQVLLRFSRVHPMICSVAFESYKEKITGQNEGLYMKNKMHMLKQADLNEGTKTHRL